MDTLRFPTFYGTTAVIAIEQIACIYQALGSDPVTWYIELKSGSTFRVEDEYGRRFARWFAGDITLQELLEEPFIA
jgi:hypothetical protein